MQLSFVFADETVCTFGNLSEVEMANLTPTTLRAFCFENVWCEFPDDEVCACIRTRVVAMVPEKTQVHHVRIRTTKRTFFLFCNGDVFCTSIVGRSDAILRDVILTEREKKQVAPFLRELKSGSLVFEHAKGHFVDAVAMFLPDSAVKN